MDDQTKEELKELATTRLFAIRISEQTKFVIDPYFEITTLPLALLDIKAISIELKTAFDTILDIDLTIHQSRVCLLIASGFSYDHISTILKIDKTTVTNHKSHIFAKILELHRDPKNISRYDTRSLLTLLVLRLLGQTI